MNIMLWSNILFWRIRCIIYVILLIRYSYASKHMHYSYHLPKKREKCIRIISKIVWYKYLIISALISDTMRRTYISEINTAKSSLVWKSGYHIICQNYFCQLCYVNIMTASDTIEVLILPLESDNLSILIVSSDNVI